MPFSDCAVNVGHYSRDEFVGVLGRAREVGVGRVLLIGGDVKGSREALRLAREEAVVSTGVKVMACVGVHPTSSLSWEGGTEDELRTMLKDPLCAAVGECGLSYRASAPPSEVQKWVYTRQVALAEEFSLPLFLHQRGLSKNDLVAALSPEMYKTCVIHCFTARGEDLCEYLKLGFTVSFSGYLAMSTKGLPLRHDMAKIANLASHKHQFLVETDAPFMKPDLYNDNVPTLEKDKRSEPCHVTDVVKCLSEVVGVDMEEVLEQNFEKFFEAKRNADTDHTKQPTTKVTLQRRLGKKKKNNIDGPKFIVPHTLAKLAKQMRGVGLDTTMMNTNIIHTLVEIANTEGRTILLRHMKQATRDKLGETPWMPLESDDTTEQVNQVLRAHDLCPTQSDLQKRCVVCNACQWEKATPEAVKAELGDIVETKKVFRCGGCRKLYWEGGIFKKAQAHFKSKYMNNNGEEKGSGSSSSPPAVEDDDTNAAVLCKKTRGGMSAESRQLAKKEIHILFVHNNYGVVLMQTRQIQNSVDGAKWEIPKTHAVHAPERVYARRVDVSHVEASDWESILHEAVDRVSQSELGIRLPRHQVYPAVDKETGEEIVKGRRTYVIGQIRDADAAGRGAEGARPPLSGEDCWLRSGRPFTFVKNFYDAAGMVKRSTPGSAGKVDIVGSSVLKWLSARAGCKRLAKRTDESKTKSFEDASSDVLNFTETSHHEDYIDSISAVTAKLKTKGFKTPDLTRALWDWKPRHLGGGAHVPSVEKHQTPSNPPHPTAPPPPVALHSWYMEKVVGDENNVLNKVRGVKKIVEKILGRDIVVFGSTATGVAESGGYDVDICVVGRGEGDEKKQLLEISDVLEGSGYVNDVAAVLTARVPVLRTEISSIPVDFTLRPEGCYNSSLFREYFSATPFLRPLACAVKKWGTWSGVKSSSIGWLTSYSLQLLLLYSLLQGGFIPHRPVNTEFPPPIESLTYSKTGNYKQQQDLSVVLQYFFRYYGWEHDWENTVVCIINPVGSEVVSKDELGWGEAATAIRDPFETELNLTRRTKEKTVSDIARRFRLSYAALECGDLKRLYQTPP